MKVLVLGAGFGGLELTTQLAEALGGEAEITLIDKSAGFVFGFSKFELVFGRQPLQQVRSYYRDIVKPGVQFRQETILAIDPAARRVQTDKGTHEADILVVALGAEYDIEATPGLMEGGCEFYSVEGAMRLKDVLPTFAGGHAIVAVLGEPYKCPPAPCEMALLLDEYLVERGLRGRTRITLTSPFARPIPPSPDGSKAILERFAERDIAFRGETLVVSLDPEREVANLADGGAIPYDLFLAIPRHRVPAVVAASGLAEDGWVPVDKATLATRFPGVYAIGDVTSVGTPKAGVFAESAGRTVAGLIVQTVRGGPAPAPFDARGTCYVELGEGMVGRIDADFLTGPPKAPFTPPSPETAEEKRAFATTRRGRWFGA
jgi:sulfide:quinone oxidoreductase